MAFSTIIKVKKTNDTAKIPVKATKGANGFDLTAVSKRKVYETASSELKYIEYGTGISIELPEDYAALVLPRSSVTNTSLMLGNSVGLIDSDYRGEITLRFRTNNQSISEYMIGDRIGQLLILKVPRIVLEESLELSDTERGEKGYGSTGNENLGG
jgi:dUTP pyrophosphatase